MLVRDVPAGKVFSYDVGVSNCEFIKLSNVTKFNVLNTASWTPANIDEDIDVVVEGDIALKPVIETDSNCRPRVDEDGTWNTPSR